MRLLLHGNAPWLTSAYASQIAMLARRIGKYTDNEVVAISAPYSGTGTFLEWEGIPVLPAVRDVAGCDILPSHYEWFKADALISLCDPFGLLKCAKELARVNWFPWWPVDVRPLGEADTAVLRESGCTPIAMSKFGLSVLRDEGADPLFAPHCIDTGIFRPGDPSLYPAYRQTVPGITESTFVIGMVAMNRGRRKAFDQQLLAFARFHARHPDSFMALHTAPVGPAPATNLPGLAARLGISGAVTFPDSYMYDTGQVTQEMLASFYGGIDVLTACSYGEGFCVPLIEAQACGTPVICTDASAMTEICGAGWTVNGTLDWEDGHGGWWVRPDAADIEQAYEAAWLAREEGRLPRKEARDFALQYDADAVFARYWAPLLAEIGKRIA